MEILTKVNEIIKTKLSLDNDFKLSEKTSLDELNADSMDLVEIIMEIENEFDIIIPESAEKDIFTVKDVVKVIQNQMK